MPERFTSLDEAEEYYDEAEDEENYLFYAEFAITTDKDDDFSASLINAIRSGEITIGGEDGEDDIGDDNEGDDDDDDEEYTKNHPELLVLK